MRQTIFFAVIVIVQFFCALFFVSDILLTVLNIRATPIAWHIRELLEIGASIGLILGVIVGGVALSRTLQKSRESEEKLRLVSAAFMDVVDEKFGEWSLTAAEKDVALFLLKGMSTQEISDLRQTSEGTVKAQTNAIYRKAEVTGRPQLLSLFIDDLMDDVSLPAKSEAMTYAAK
mgnify:FL=1